MGAGFQSFNAVNGNFQIDGTYKNLAVIRSGTVTPIKTVGLDAGPNVYDATITVNAAAGELLAFGCDVYCGLLWTTANSAKIRVIGPNLVRYYIFGAGAPPGSYGLQVFNETTQELVFDATWRVFNVVDIRSGYGAVSYVSGREYAVLYIAQSASHELTVQWIIPNSVYIVRRNYYSDMVVMAGEQVTISSGLMSQVVGQDVTPPDAPDPFFYSNGLSMRMMILDVTGFI